MNEGVRQTLTTRVYDVAVKTPLDYAKKLSKNLDNEVYFKREDMQPVFSFKIRGAYNKIASLSPIQRSQGVIAASAGNHAQGVAYSARKLGIRATIVMPKTTPHIKIDAVESYGGKVVLFGDSYSDAAEHCKELIKKTGMTYIPPFDDELVIAGQGTVGQEVLEQLPDVDYIFVPIGGGGLAAGVAQYVKNVKPHVKIIGVEPNDSNAMQQSLEADKRLDLPYVSIFADGVAVKQVGKMTFDLVKEYVDEVITVTTDELCAAIKAIFEESRNIVEPAGALGVAGIQKYAELHTSLDGKKLVAINSGGNMNFERLQLISERTLIGSHREALYAIELDEKPGTLELFCNKTLGKRAISEFNYRCQDGEKAEVLVGILVSEDRDKQAFERDLDRDGYAYTDLTSNELLKEHVRHTIGGKSSLPYEQLVSFEFPERPGALKDFLSHVSKRWNITLFHYRGLGNSIGRVLIGFDLTKEANGQFQEFLKEVEFPYTVETDNPAYKIFLR